jgi:hypothetical protein
MYTLRKIDEDIQYLLSKNCSFGVIEVNFEGTGFVPKNFCRTKPINNNVKKYGQLTICEIEPYGIFLNYPNGDLHLSIFETSSAKPHVTFYPNKNDLSLEKENRIKIVYHYGTDETHIVIGPWGNGTDQLIKNEMVTLFNILLPKIKVIYDKENDAYFKITPKKTHVSNLPSSNVPLTPLNRKCLKWMR